MCCNVDPRMDPISPILNVILQSLHSVRDPPEIARVNLSTRTNLPGGFGGIGDYVLIVVAVVALPLFLLLLKTPPGPPKPPGNLARVENHTRAISGAGL